ncbi:MAG TPA: menaquinone biosynthesis protein [Saprospiraceae bacterium]|nr:menaquinone biosynthesis protein [Saprospiraceae bacterium]HMP25056.1 menaquinone biosynthesis protein [Saprospiraceae bacterium]
MVNKKYKLTAVSYLNTKPLLYGIFKSKIAERIELQLNMPSVCAQKLQEGSADIGLVPVAVIPELATPHIISDYCIGTVGAVQTVCLYGETPIENWNALYLDYQSRTSVELTKVLLGEYWQLHPTLLNAEPGYESKIAGRTGGLVIGDRTIGMNTRYPYVYDLGDIWMRHTGLPFVFAAWVSNRPLDAEFIAEFNEALAQGIAAIPELTFLLPEQQAGFDLETYFTRHISYYLDNAKRHALSLFLSKISPDAPPPILQFDSLVQHEKNMISVL